MDTPPQQLDLRGAVVDNRFTLLRRHKRTRRSDIWVATDDKTMSMVCFKWLVAAANDIASVAAFRQGVLVLQSLSPEFTARPIAVGTFGANAYVVTDWLVGETLAEHLERRSPLSESETLNLALSVVQSLAEGHTLALIHGELWPSNVFMCADGTARVLDWGLARLFGRHSIYVDPAGTRGDILGLGALLYMARTGRRWSPGAPALDGVIGDVVRRCTAREERPSAMRLLLDLSRVGS